MNSEQNIPLDLFTPASDNTAKQEHIARQHHSAFYDGWIRLRKNRAAVVCAVIILIIAIMSAIVPVTSKYTYYDTDYSNKIA